MNRHATDGQEPVQEWAPSSPLPADHVLFSGAVLFPGAFDQHGCPLVVFPVDGHAKIASELSKAEVVDFINYFLCLHNKKQEKNSLASVVADLREASLPATRFIAETLLLLELHTRTVHTVYLLQPKKKDIAKLLMKLLSPSKSYNTSFKKVLLKEIPELSNYIDRSQLPASLGGYLMYSHQSWVAFTKDIDAFVQEFLSVVQRLPSCISTLQALSRLPLPSTHSELQRFCSTNEAQFRQLRRELGLDELLQHCESVVEKLRFPDCDPCYQAMAGTTLFTHTAFDMLHNHSRITAAVEKVDVLWQQAFSKACSQLQVLQLRDEALQVTEKIETLLQVKVQPYKIDIARDTAKAGTLAAEFEGSIHTPAMALVHYAEDVIQALGELLPLDGHSKESWILDLERLKDKLHSAVDYILQTLRAVSNYHHYYDKANRWYDLVLHENFLQELLTMVHGDEAAGQRQRTRRGTTPAWRRKLSSFLRKNPSPEMEELVHLAHLSNVIPDNEAQQAGNELSQRCMTLRKLLISSGPVEVRNLQLALQWQYDLLRSSHANESSPRPATHGTLRDGQPSSPESPPSRSVGAWEATHRPEPSPAVCGIMFSEGKPPSLNSFDSGFVGAASSQLEASGGRRGESLSRLRGSTDSVRPALSPPLIHEETISLVSDSEDHRQEFDLGSVGNSSRASFQITPKVTADSLNFEIKVKRSAALPSNPWLSLPVEDLENSYTVTITPNPTPQESDRFFSDSSDPQSTTRRYNVSPDRPAPIEVSRSADRQSQTRDWILQSHGELGDPDLSSITNVLSSTMTEEREGTMCDSYDLLDQNLDAVDGEDVSLEDWDVREQEGLQEVEKMLGRADQILEEEENVLAQEAVLNALLTSEDASSVWPQWDGEGQPREMSTTELAEAGVLGLEDSLDPSESDGDLESESITGGSAEDRFYTDSAGLLNSRPDLLRELQKVQLLDELITEENLKIQKLQFSEETPADELRKNQPVDSKGPVSVSREREAFRTQLLEEEMEVEKLEEHLNKEPHVRNDAGVVKCSVENKRSQGLLENLLAHSCSRSRSTSSALNDHQNTLHTAGLEAVSDLQVGPEDTLQHGGQRSQGRDLSGSEVDPSLCDGTRSGGSSDLQKDCEDGVQLQRWCSVEELDKPPETPSETEAVRASSGLVVTKEASDPTSRSYRRDLGGSEVDPSEPLKESVPPQDGPEGSGTTWTPQAPSTPQMRPDSQVFNPGVTPLVPPPSPPPPPPPPPPVPTPRQVPLPVNDGLAQLDVPHSAAAAVSDRSSEAPRPGFIELDLRAGESETVPQNLSPGNNPSVKEQSNNNNNHSLPMNCHSSLDRVSERFPKDEKDVSTVTVNSHYDEGHQLLGPELPPDECVEFDPGGEAEPVEDWLSDLQDYESVRSSHCGSPGVQVQPTSSMRKMADFKTPIVLDTGSGLMKAGFAGQDLPSVTFPTMIGMPKYEEIMNGQLERETFIGHDAQHMRGVLTLKHPIKNGIVRNWDEMEKIWHHTFQQLGVEPEEHPVLLTEAAMTPLANRQRMVEIMFECFSVPLAYVAMQAVLALYADGRSTGVVFDSGDGVSHSVPVFEGYCLPHAVQRFPLAGLDVTMHLKKLLQEQGVSMRTTAEEEIVRDMKEKCCYVSPGYKAELQRGGSSRGEMNYTMPDGQTVTLSSERFRAAEILFKPELIGRDHYGMHESIFKSILGSDIDLRRSFLGNIVLSGGNTLLCGLPQRLQAELQGLVPLDLRDSVRVSSPEGRDFSVWSGGAVMAGLPSFSLAWISQEEYEEYGPQIVFRKCF